MRSRFIGIAGGSGSGKSALCFSLRDRYPERFAILHLDDYHKSREHVPVLRGMLNWDHPDAVDFDKLLSDLQSLKEGKTITVQTKNERDNPEYHTGGRIPIRVQPKPIILLEGFLALWHPMVRKFLDCAIYLDCDVQQRMERRAKFRDDAYEQEILLPMHEKFVEPTKNYADAIVNILEKSQEAVCAEVENIINHLQSR